MLANAHPGWEGTAARLPYSPGTQKLTPPSSAMACRGPVSVTLATIAIGAIAAMNNWFEVFDASCLIGMPLCQFKTCCTHHSLAGIMRQTVIGMKVRTLRNRPISGLRRDL